MTPQQLLASTGNAHLENLELPLWVQRWEESLNTLSASYKKA